MKWVTIKKCVYSLPKALEMVVGVIISFVICIAIVGVVMQTSPRALIENGDLIVFLQRAAEIIIGIEFVRLIFSHTMDATLEVIIMAIVRQIIIGHLTAVDTLVFVFSIAILFVIRKFFFIRKLDKDPEADRPEFNWFLGKKKARAMQEMKTDSTASSTLSGSDTTDKKHSL